MTRRPDSQHRVAHARASWLRPVVLAAAALSFLFLAYAGSRGHRHARRQADLEDVVLCRVRLQEALDAQRSAATGPTPKRSTMDAQMESRAVKEWAAKLKGRLTEFGAKYAPAAEAEVPDLRLGSATLAIAEDRFVDALATINAPLQQPGSATPAMRDPGPELLRLRADAHYDSGNWSTALEDYRAALLRQPEDLGAVELAAACLHSLKQLDRALDAYADLARRLHDRGSRRLEQLDLRNAAQDLNKAATIRLWLFENGRRELAADLAQSFSTCAAALLEINSLDIAKAYLANAIDIRTQLIHQGRTELRRKLARDLGQRGLVRQAQGLRSEAAQDFEKAAETFAGMGDFAEAVVWQEKALNLAGGEARRSSQLRLDQYRSQGSSSKG